MVAPSVPRLGFEPEICLARPILVHALDCYERGDHIGAGVRLREAVRRFVVSACRWYAIDLTKAMRRDKFGRTPTLVKALRDAKVCGNFDVEILHECHTIGSHAAHCRPFCVKQLSSAISLLFCLLDSEPFAAMKDRQQVAVDFEDADYSCDDCDDDDSADGWKKGGAA